MERLSEALRIAGSNAAAARADSDAAEARAAALAAERQRAAERLAAAKEVRWKGLRPPKRSS